MNLRSFQSMGCTPDFALQKYREPGSCGKYNTLRMHMGSMCIMQWDTRSFPLFPGTEKMLGVCLVRTVIHDTVEHETGLGHKEDKKNLFKIFKQAEKLPVVLEPYSDK